MTDFAKTPRRMARFSRIESNISDAKVRNVKFGKKNKRNVKFLPDFRYFRISEGVLERVLSNWPSVF